jgi:membrane protein insertase Oxa1/YidC/SpoIIIJ
MPDHLKDGLVTHFSLLAVSHKRQQAEIQAYQTEIKALNKIYQEEIKTIRGEVDELKKQTEHMRLNM